MQIRELFNWKALVLAIVLTLAIGSFGIESGGVPGWVIVKQNSEGSYPPGILPICLGENRTFGVPLEFFRWTNLEDQIPDTINAPAPYESGCAGSGWIVVNPVTFVVDILLWLLIANLILWIFRRARTTKKAT